MRFSLGRGRLGPLAVAGILGLLLPVMVTAASPAAAATSGPYQIQVEHSGKCVDNYRGQGFTNNPIQQWDCAPRGASNYRNQEWHFWWQDDGWALLINGGTRMCLGPKYRDALNGMPVVLQSCDDAVEWKGFLMHRGGRDYYQLSPIHAQHMCLDMARSAQENGARFQLWSCQDANANQHFTWF